MLFGCCTAVVRVFSVVRLLPLQLLGCSVLGCSVLFGCFVTAVVRVFSVVRVLHCSC